MSTFFPELPPRIGVDAPQWGDSATQVYEAQVRQWMEAAFEEAKFENTQGDEVREMAKYIDYIVGKQWPGNLAAYKAKPVNNRVWRLFWELVSLLTDVRPMFEVRAMQGQYADQAKIINQCTKSWWMESDADMTLAMIVVYALLCTGYGKLEWNPGLRNGEGDFNLIPLGPNDVMPLKARHSLDSAQAVIYQTPQPLGWFRQKFPVRGILVRPDPLYSRFATPDSTPKGMAGMMFDRLSPAMQRVMGSNTVGRQNNSMCPMALYREFWIQDFSYNTSNVRVKMGEPNSNWCYWVEPGQPLYHRGRLIVMGGDQIMYDGPNPYWHGKPPFAAMRMNVVPWQFHGLSEIKPLTDLQDVVNQIMAGVLNMVKKALNPAFIAPKNAFSPEVFNSLDWGMPGAKAQYSMAAAHPPAWQPPPVLPAFVLNMLMLASREMDTSSGLASVAEAVHKKQVPAADTLEQIKQTQQTPIRLKGRNIEQFLRHLGSMTISNTFQFYSAKRRLFMMGTDGLTFQDFDYDPNSMVPAGMKPEDHARNFAFLIHPGTLLNINQVEKQMLILKLRAMKDIDRGTMYQQLDLGLDASKIEAALEKELKQQLDTQLSAQVLAAAAQHAQTGGGAPQ